MFVITSIYVISYPQSEKVYANLSQESLRNSSSSFRSSHWRCSKQNAVLKKFAIFSGKQLQWSLFFSKVVDLQGCNSIKKRLQHRCFSVKFAKFLRITFFLQSTCGSCFCRQTDIYSTNIMLKHNDAKKQK